MLICADHILNFADYMKTIFKFTDHTNNFADDIQSVTLLFIVYIISIMKICPCNIYVDFSKVQKFENLQ